MSAGADIDSEDEQGDTPFVHAFRGKHKEVTTLSKSVLVFIFSVRDTNWPLVGRKSTQLVAFTGICVLF